MITHWMLQCAFVSILLAMAALACEQVLRLWRREARFAWAAAMLGSLGIPILSLGQVLGWLPRVGDASTTGTLGPASIAVLLDPIRIDTGLSRLDLVMGVAWLTASAALTLRFVLAARSLARRRASWRAAVVDGEQLLVSADAGPAVVGVQRPAIVIPEWVLELDRPLRALVLRHEREHLEHGDPRLLFAAVSIATIAPWNPLLWYQLHRLRSAMELDCDARVLRAYPNPRKYGSLLLAVAQRGDRGALLQAALTESNSLLGRRIKAMRKQLTSFRATQTAVFSIAAILAGFVACEVQAPAQPNTADQRRASPAVVEQPYFEFQVEQPVRAEGSTVLPRYPDALRKAGVEGVVLAQFVVGPDGLADVGSFKILKSSDPLFVDAVRAALPKMRFKPALVGGRAVRQLVQEPFTFALSK